MKTSTATSLALTAVFAAGALALFVNTRALGDTVGGTDTETTIGVQAMPSISPDSTQTAQIADTAPQVSSNQDATASEVTEYELDGIGVVRLEKNEGSLQVLNVEPTAGYSFDSSQISADQVRVEFLSETTEVEFRARLLEGRIITDVQAKPVGMRYDGDDDDEDDDDDDGDEYDGDERHDEQGEDHEHDDDDD